MLEPSYCPRHSGTETQLRCSRCEELVCPSCMVHSAVGVRCPDCAQTKRPPTFDVTGIFLARAIGASLGLGLLCGVAFKILSFLLARIPSLGGIPFWEAIAFAGIGYAIGEGVSLSVNRKRGGKLKLVASSGVLVAYVVSTLPFAGTAVGPVGLLGLVIAFYVSIRRF